MTGERLFRFSAPGPAPLPERGAAWTVMIVDDDRGIHDVTEIALQSFSFDGKGLHLIHCFSAEHAKQAIAENPETALIILDVVMEREHAGLDLVRHIREVLKNKLVRIILRTGQPGVAPEGKVIRQYDINDYKDKTELTAARLETAIFNCLRSYRDIRALENSRISLEAIVHGVDALFVLGSIEEVATVALGQVASILHATPTGFSGIIATTARGRLKVVAATEDKRRSIGQMLDFALQADERQALAAARAGDGRDFSLDRFVRVYKAHDEEAVIMLSGLATAGPAERGMIDMFAQNLSTCLANLALKAMLSQAHAELAAKLVAVVAPRPVGDFVNDLQVGEMAARLGHMAGLPADEVEILRQAAPLRDLGKIGVPEAILAKAGPLSEEEWQIVRTHTVRGASILAGSMSPVLKAAAQIALCHHERWDGTGYPHKHPGDHTPIYGRIVAIIDAFHALSNRRPYAAPWDDEQIADHFVAERGRQFDPQLTDLFLSRFDTFTEIRDRGRLNRPAKS